jgi:hypothetical protein
MRLEIVVVLADPDRLLVRVAEDITVVAVVPRVHLVRLPEVTAAVRSRVDVVVPLVDFKPILVATVARMV